MSTTIDYVVVTWEQLNTILKAIEEIRMHYAEKNLDKISMNCIEQICTELAEQTNTADWNGPHAAKRITAVEWIGFTTIIMVYSLETLGPTSKYSHSDALVAAVEYAKLAIKEVDGTTVVKYVLSKEEVDGILDMYMTIEKLYAQADMKNELLIEHVRSAIQSLQAGLTVMDDTKQEALFSMSLTYLRMFCCICQMFSDRLKEGGKLHCADVYVPFLEIAQKQLRSNQIIHRLLSQH